MSRRIALRIVLALLVMAGLAVSPGLARADGARRVVVPAGGGLDAVDVAIDAGAGVIRIVRGGHSKEIPITIERSRIDSAASAIEIIPVGEGRSVARVRVPDVQRLDLAFEAVISGQSDAPIFAGLTGYTQGEEGDRSGQLVLVKEREGQSKFVIVAETREDTRICGQAVTPLGAQGVDAKRMQLVGATLPRIDKKAREGAQHVIAQARTNPATPLARVLVATGGSSPNAPALTDGTIDTTGGVALCTYASSRTTATHDVRIGSGNGTS